METKHTPAPWKIASNFQPETGGHIIASEDSEADGFAIANIFGADNLPCLDEEDDDYNDVKQEIIANARLMAA